MSTPRSLSVALAIAWLILLWQGTVVAGEAPRTQPLLLPMAQLLKHLDAKQEWMLLPIAEYRALSAAAAERHAMEPVPPAGASIETARITGKLSDDRLLHLEAEVMVTSAVSGATRVRLFAVHPPRLGAVTIDGVPALYAADGEGLDLVVPGAGRHVVTVAWDAQLSGDDRVRRGPVALPLAGGVDLRLTSLSSGSFAGTGLVEDTPTLPAPNAVRSWRLAGAVHASLSLAWHPGRLTASDEAVFGIEQAVQVQVLDGQSPLRWVARVQPRRGPSPAMLTLTLPDGWVFTTPGAGVISIEGGRGTVRLHLDPSVREIVCDGFRDADAVLALPAVADAAYHGGVIVARSDLPIDCDLPVGWRVESSAAGQERARVFAVPAADAGMRVALVRGEEGLSAMISAVALIGPGINDWRLTEAIEVRSDRARLFPIPVQVPAGWRLESITGDRPLRVAQLDHGDAAGDLPPGSRLDVMPTAVGERLKLVLTLVRATPDGRLEPATIVAARRSSQRLLLLAAPGLDTRIVAAAPWRVAAASEAHAATYAALVRAELLATGTPGPVALTVSAKPPACEAEAILYLLPGNKTDGGTWCRLDLKLLVRDGELDAISLPSPFAQDARPPFDDRLFTLAVADGRLRLEARQPWQGEHLLRLEGPLAEALAGKFPRISITRRDGGDVPVRQIVVVQAPAQADLALTPGKACLTIDEDELPAWSRAIPGDPVFAVFRCQLGELGGFALVERPLAPVPRGFLDQVELRTQVAASGTVTLVRARIAAPTLQALPLHLDPGMRLLEATIDGVAVPVRFEVTGAGAATKRQLVLPLPGRTQVQVALLVAGGLAGRQLELIPPRLGDLPVTRVAWTVAVAEGLLATPSTASEVMPLLGDSGADRPWFATWREAAPWPFAVAVPVAKQGPVSGDARALTPPPRTEVPRGEPTLVLNGHYFAGERIGNAAALRLALVPIADLTSADRWGWVLAVLAAAVLTWRATWRLRLAVAVAAGLAACGLHGVSWSSGPWLALCEWLPMALAVAAVLAWFGRWRLAVGPSPTLAAARLVLLGVMSLTGMSAAEAQPVLMGYERLDQAGMPQAVRVALTRDQLTELWRRAGKAPVAATAPVCELATGAALYALGREGNRLTGTLRLPLAVLGDGWQLVRIPIAAGMVRSVRVLPLGAVAAPLPQQVTWTIDGAGLVVSMAGHRQGLVEVALDLPLSDDAGAMSARLPVLATRGGALAISGPAELGLAFNGETVTTITPGRWQVDLPPGRELAELVFRPQVIPVPSETQIALDQRLRVTIAPARLEWQGDFSFDIQGGGVRQVRLDLPPALALATVEGPELAAWRQQGAVVEVSWTTPRSGTVVLHATGLLPRTAAVTSAAIAVRLPEARRSTGRADLVHGSEARFLRPELPALERTEPQAGADLALRWADAPPVWTVAWQVSAGELRLTEQIAVVAGLDRVRIGAVITVSGRGATDALHLRLAAPWRLVSANGLKVAWQGVDAARLLVLRGDGPWRSGTQAVVVMEAERRELPERFVAPDLTPQGDGVALERQTWLVGDAGDRRVRIERVPTLSSLAVEPLAEALTRAGVTLRPGEAWRLAVERRGGNAPELSLAAEPAQVRVAASHYLVLGAEQVRWWVRLTFAIDQGELTELRCAIPAAAKLTRVAVRDLGDWRREQGELVVRLAAPTRQPVALELELELPIGGDAVKVEALTTSAGQPLVDQQVALAEEDDLGLVHIAPQGLEDARDQQQAMVLPDGVDAAKLPHRWHASRPGWQLAITREALAASTGVDGVATLVDALSVLERDGELRGRASWHVLNRSRQQLPLIVPPGVDLWEVRLDGRVVRPRLDADASTGRLWVPVRALRPGEAELRLDLTWRQRVDASRPFSPLMPAFAELRIIQSLWRLVPPPGCELRHRDGALKPGLPGEAEADRARRVIDGLQRLRNVGSLNDNGLKRLDSQLCQLDLELNDYLVGINQVGGGNDEVARAAAQVRQQAGQIPMQQQFQQQQEVLSAVNSNIAQVKEQRLAIDDLNKNRQGRRKALGLGNRAQTWNNAADAGKPMVLLVDTDFLARTQPSALPWRPALAVAAGETLGAGEPPSGRRGTGTGGLLGVELVGAPSDGGLVLRGQGGDLSVELALVQQGPSWWSWLALGSAALVLLAGWRFRR